MFEIEHSSNRNQQINLENSLERHKISKLAKKLLRFMDL